MSIRIALHHQTRYRYDRLVSLSPHEIRLRPAPHCRTRILSYSLNLKPERHFINWQQDPYGNYIARCVFPEKTRELDITVDLVADMTAINPFDFFVAPEAMQYPFRYSGAMAAGLAPYLAIEERGPLLTEWVAQCRARHAASGVGTTQFLSAVNNDIIICLCYYCDFKIPRYRPPDWPPSPSANSGDGVRGRARSRSHPLH